MVEWLPEWESRMDPGLVECIKAGTKVSMVDYQKARERKYSYNVAIHSFFEDWDFLLSPAVSVAAFPADRLQPEHWPQHSWDWISWAEFLYPFDLSGNPAAIVPCGFTKDGLPVACRSWAGASTTWVSCRPRRPSRPPIPGRTGDLSPDGSPPQTRATQPSQRGSSMSERRRMNFHAPYLKKSKSSVDNRCWTIDQSPHLRSARARCTVIRATVAGSTRPK